MPGEVAGCHEAVRRWGRLPLRRVLQPAIELTRAFPVDHDLQFAIGATRLTTERGFGWLLPGGKLPELGATLRNDGLGATLRRIASDGPAGFYQGPTARSIVGLIGLVR